MGRIAGVGAGFYIAAAAGLVGSVVAARGLGPRDFGLFALALATAAFAQGLLDLSVEEACVKYGARFALQDDGGRLRRLFAVALRARFAGGIVATAAIAGSSFAAEGIFDAEGIAAPMAIAALMPLVQVGDTPAAAIVVRRRYGLRSALVATAGVLRVVGIAVGVPFGATAAVTGALAGQAAATALTGLAGAVALRRLPGGAPRPLGPHAAEIRRYVLHTSIGSSLVSARGWAGTLVIGAVAGPVQAGYLRTAQISDQALASLSAPARLVLLGEHSAAWERGEHAQVLRAVGRYMVVAGLVALAVIPPAVVFAPRLVPLIFSDAYSPAVTAVRIAAVAAAVAFVFGWSKPFAASIGRPGLRTAVGGLELAVLLPPLAVLGSRHGAAGGAVALLAAACAGAGAWLVILVRMRRSLGRPGAVQPAL